MILNIDTAQKSGGYEVTLNFDVPYEGSLIQQHSTKGVALFLPQVTIPAPWHQRLAKGSLQIDLIPQKDGTQILIHSKERLTLKALRPKDGFSITLVLRPQKLLKQEAQRQEKLYLLWGMFVLALLALGWGIWRLWRLWKEDKETPFRIKYEYALDQKNRIILLSYNGVDYLILTGAKNVLLGRYKEDQIVEQDHFFDLLHHKISLQSPPQEDSTIDEYKRKASGDL